MNPIIEICPIKKKDNKKIAAVIRAVLIEFNAPLEGTAYADPHLDELFETYERSRSIYYVIKKNGELVGGAGIMQLEATDKNICELQKMYFSPSVRGIGMGAKMMDLCLKFAKETGFGQCYLETLPYMKEAQLLYKKSGFNYIDNRIGKTGHYSCDVWMLKDL
ncbi:MAG: GNAT family N-acetyltransferase [Flavobacteriaceae bacterium]|nr:MAG: GNAT family N-acetyltransferase [Flavobacteriaceae bacterium]